MIQKGQTCHSYSCSPPVLKGCGPIDTQEAHGGRSSGGIHISPAQVYLQEVQEAGHGGEEKHPMPRRLLLDQNAVQHRKLAALLDQDLRLVELWRVCQRGVIADLHGRLAASVTRGTTKICSTLRCALLALRSNLQISHCVAKLQMAKPLW